MIEGGKFSKGRALELLGNILSYGVSQQVDQLEAVLISKDRNLTRFAKSKIHQNMNERTLNIVIRVLAGKKQGCIHLNTLEIPKLEKGVEQALKIAKLQPGNPNFVSLPSHDTEKLPDPARYERMTYFNQTTVHPPEEKGNEIRDLINLCTSKKEDYLAGAFATEVSEVAVVNSLGVEVYFPATLASINVNISGPSGATGYAEKSSRNVKDIDMGTLAKELKRRLKLSRNPQKLDAKVYPTVFEHYAVGELLIYLSSMGFSAKAVAEGWSFLTDNFGKKIVSEKMSIWDDGNDGRGLPIPFDYEGVPKHRVDIIKEGIANSVVYDSFTAGLEGKSSTGHALPAPNPLGPQPQNLFMGEGDSSLKEMIEDTKSGILVSRIHYANPLDPKKTSLTGMTRDGTFLIKKGEIHSAVKNLRFTQSLLEAFSSTKLIGKTIQPTRTWYGTCTVPTLKVEKFNFTGTTEH